MTKKSKKIELRLRKTDFVVTYDTLEDAEQGMQEFDSFISDNAGLAIYVNNKKVKDNK